VTDEEMFRRQSTETTVPESEDDRLARITLENQGQIETFRRHANEMGITVPREVVEQMIRHKPVEWRGKWIPEGTPAQEGEK
jgi:hypothetical protein